ncbi:hypothetical protein Pcinc_040886 [Petrolisthes cinctipes]|uniref:Uncharacterized protein n=1 Tax=Petrolisthes cinctipes TaxID=88211 RepID=A0AAE1BKZ5_PETCI|nr:hypothetical protein Pcinc_040886 [Petrolisthes cinctipes]
MAGTVTRVEIEGVSVADVEGKGLGQQRVSRRMGKQGGRQAGRARISDNVITSDIIVGWREGVICPLHHHSCISRPHGYPSLPHYHPSPPLLHLMPPSPLSFTPSLPSFTTTLTPHATLTVILHSLPAIPHHYTYISLLPFISFPHKYLSPFRLHIKPIPAVFLLIYTSTVLYSLTNIHHFRASHYHYTFLLTTTTLSSKYHYPSL